MNRNGLHKVQAAIIAALIIAVSLVGYFAMLNYVLQGSPSTMEGGATTSFGESELYVSKEESAGSKKEESIRYVVDIVGRNVTLPEKINRVAAIGPGMLRLVCYLNAVDMLVGIEESEIKWGFRGRDYAMAYGERFKDLPIIGPGGPGKPPAPELIITVKPDLIIMSRTYCDFYDPDRLQSETKAAVIVIDYGPAGQLDINGFIYAMRVLGKALNREERAEQIIRFTVEVSDDLNRRTKDIDQRPKVYVGAISYKGAQPFTTTQTPFPPLVLLNTPSIADKYSSGAGVFFWDYEAIIAEQPEIIFIDEGNLATVKQDFEKDPGKYMQLSTFRKGRVYGTLPYNYYHTNIAVALADAYWMGKVLYPDRFSDVDPITKADEIFTVFVGKPLYQMYADAYGGFICLADMFRVP
ncbi:MAG: ABC transporter substrate-binding protein [Candidatus Bathyarchaeia archaeon]